MADAGNAHDLLSSVRDWIGSVGGLIVAALGSVSLWVRRISGKVEDQRIRIAVLETQHQECAQDRRDSIERQRQIHQDLHKVASKLDELIGEFRAARRSDGARR